LFKKNGLETLCGKDTLTLSERERNLQANAYKQMHLSFALVFILDGRRRKKLNIV